MYLHKEKSSTKFNVTRCISIIRKLYNWSAGGMIGEGVVIVVVASIIT